MQSTIPVVNCTGCSACRCCCPQQAIEMIEDFEGFLYPRVAEQKCSQCGLCVKICPVKNAIPVESIETPTVYAAWTKDQQVLRESSSGGVFSELARVILEQRGVVFGAAYDEQMTVRHIAVESVEELRRLRGSKYVQSDVGDTYRQAEQYLSAGRRVLYTGSPCQVAGLYATIGNDYANLLTCDFICHGTPSPKVFRLYLAYLAMKYHSRVTDFLFRDKQHGWLHPLICIMLKNGRILKMLPADNFYSIGFYRDIYTRPSCYVCSSKGEKILADITIGDFWQLIKYQPELLNHAGTSALLIHTERGRQIIEKCRPRLALTECSFSYLRSDSMLRKCITMPPNRAAFFEDLDHMSFGNLINKYMKPRSSVLRIFAKARRLCWNWIIKTKH